MTVRYEENGPDVLKNINLTLNPGERVAIVGRTGSGKSTLLLSILRLTHIVSGRILYDGVDITAPSRKRLRKEITVIPQEAALFSGTVGWNLDPAGTVERQVLEAAVKACSGIASLQMTQNNSGGDTVLINQGDGIKLDTPVAARGENFSHGQRQVISLCRALVKRSNLALLDEATASMDYATDRAIQRVLRDEFMGEMKIKNNFGHLNNRTLITVAHRLHTVMDYDKVVVMADGKVVEVASPWNLWRLRGVFWSMMQDSGDLKTLERFLETENCHYQE